MRYKLTIAIILTVLLLGGGIYETIFIHNTFEDLGMQIDAILDQGDEYSVESINATIKWWGKKSKQLAITIPHNQIDAISYSLHELRGTALDKDFKSSTAVLTKLLGHAENINNAYTFSFWNII